MKTVMFKEGSWHHWLAELGGHYRSDTDICTYTRAAFAGAGKVLLAVIGVILACLLVGDTLAWTVAWAAHGYAEPRLAAVVFLALLVVSAGLTLLGLVLWLYYEKAAPKLEHSFVANAWRSAKDRTCFRVQIK